MDRCKRNDSRRVDGCPTAAANAGPVSSTRQQCSGGNRGDRRPPGIAAERRRYSETRALERRAGIGGVIVVVSSPIGGTVSVSVAGGGAGGAFDRRFVNACCTAVRGR